MKGYGSSTTERGTSSLGRLPVALWRYVIIYQCTKERPSLNLAISYDAQTKG